MMYEKAFDTWPANGKLAARLASLYLVRMGMNAKAVYWGKQALKIDENDRASALYTAMFAEESGDYLDALLLLARHEDLYGDSLDTMISRARILDKEGNSEKAVAEYRAILLSGYQLPADLKRYIKGRLALEGAKSKGQM